jgi:hypothetical protein
MRRLNLAFTANVVEAQALVMFNGPNRCGTARIITITIIFGVGSPT